MGVGMLEICEMWGIRVGMWGNKVGMLEIRVGNAGI